MEIGAWLDSFKKPVYVDASQQIVTSIKDLYLGVDQKL